FTVIMYFSVARVAKQYTVGIHPATALRSEFDMMYFRSGCAALLAQSVISLIYLLLDFVAKSVALASCRFTSFVSDFRHRSNLIHLIASGNLYPRLHSSR